MQLSLALALRPLSGPGGAGSVGSVVFGNAPLQIPTSNTIFAPSASQLTGIEDQYIPPQPAGWRLVFSNFQMGAAGLTSPEILPGNANTLDYVSLFSAANGSGYVGQVTFGGSDSITIDDGGYAISDALGAWAGGYVRTSITTASGANRPRGYTTRLATAPSPIAGEVGRTYTGPQAGLKTTGTLTGGTATAAGNVYSPCAVLAPRTTQSSVLGVGNWLMTGTDEDWRVFSSSTGMWGAFARAFDDTASAQMGFGNLGQRGALGVNTSASTPGNFGCRLALLNAVKAIGNGWPFATVVSQYLPQDFASMTSPTLQDMKDRAQVIWDYLNTTFSRPLVQMTVAMPTTSPNNFWTDYADQTVTVDVGPFNDWLVDNVPYPVSLVMDTRTVLRTLTGGAWKWTPTAWTTGGGGLLTVAASSGTNLSTTGLTLSAASAPVVGEFIVMETGANGEISNQAISSVTDLGGGTYNIKVAASTTTSKTHAIGSAVYTSDTRDGVTPGPALTQRLATAIQAYKSQLPFLNVPVATGASRDMFASTRHLPANTATAVVAGTEYSAHSLTVGSPNRPLRNARFAFTAWTAQGGTSSSDPGELALGNDWPLEGVAVKIGSTYYPITFNSGSSTATVTNGNTLWSDALSVTIPANTTYQIITCDHLSIGQFRPSNYTTQTGNADGIAYGATTQSGYLTAGTLPKTGSAVTQDALVGPSMIVGQWWDGVEPVWMFTGDSQGRGFNDANFLATSRGCVSWFYRGLDDASTGRQVGWSSAIGGGRLDDWSFGGDIGFSKRKAMMTGLAQLPFTHVMNQLGINNITPAGTLAALETAYAGFVSYVKSWAPVPIYATTITPRTDRNNATNNAYGWTDLSHQSVPAGGLYGPDPCVLSQINAGILAGSYGLTGGFDTAAAVRDVSASTQVFKVPNVSTTLNTALLANTTNIVVLDAAMEVGTCLVFEPNTANVDFRKPDSNSYTVASVTGSGPYTHTIYAGRASVANNILLAHSAGVPVWASYTATGLHYQTPLHVLQGAAWAAVKGL